MVSIQCSFCLKHKELLGVPNVTKPALNSDPINVFFSQKLDECICVDCVVRAHKMLVQAGVLIPKLTIK